MENIQCQVYITEYQKPQIFRSQTDLADEPLASVHLLSLSVCLTQDPVSAPDNLESLVTA